MHQTILKLDGAAARARHAAQCLDALSIGLLALIAVIAARTFRDYGLGWDDYTHSQYGQLLVSLYSSNFSDQRALSFVNLYMYGGGFDLIATLAAKIVPFDLFATRRLVGAAIGIVGLFVTWRLGRRVGGPLAGFVALALLAACPLYYGHMFINAKDGPFAMTNALALLGILRAFDEYPYATPPTVALCGIGMGLAIGTRVLGGFTFLDALLPLVLTLGLGMRRCGLERAVSEWGRFLVAFIPAVVLAYLVMGLVWPWGVASPLNPLHAIEYFSKFFEKPWRELFAGHLLLVTEMPRDYVPVLIALKIPVLMLAAGLTGIAAALTGVFSRNTSVGRRAILLALVLAATLPVLVTVATRPGMYNGIRHFVFLTPPFAVLGGLAVTWIAPRIAGYGRTAVAIGILIFAAGVASPIVAMARLHPYQYTYYNILAGGPAGARPNFMLDYWGLSLTQASRDLLAFLIEHGESSPAGRPWAVAVCGPHPPVNVALGPQFVTTWDPKGADFALTLGEYYCAKLDAPLLFQVVRDGVVYARVYDIRGQSISSLLVVPGL